MRQLAGRVLIRELNGRGNMNLETERLIIRSFVMDDLQDIHHILDVELGPRRNQSD